jgi:integrase
MLWIPARLSSTGSVMRLRYRTKEEAAAAAKLIQIRAENLGRLSYSLTGSEITIAAKAFSLLAERPRIALVEIVTRFLAAEKALETLPGATLEKAVAAYTHSETERLASRPFGEAFLEFLEAKVGKSRTHKANLRRTGQRFAYLDQMLVSDITPKDLLKKLKKMPSSSRNREQRHLRAFFNFAIKREWRPIGSNPVDKLDFMELDNDGEVEVFSVAEVEKLLTYALTNELGLLPYLTLGFFAGIRSDVTDGELQKLDWSDVHLVGGSRPEVEIRPSVAKTGRRRFVGLSPNALAWIEAFRQRGGKLEGPIVPFSANTLRNRRRKAQAATGLASWISSGMRHSFCSYFLAKNKDVNRLTLESGHTSPDVMWRHYHRGVNETQAEEFWSLMPPAELPNVISITAVEKTG